MDWIEASHSFVKEGLKFFLVQVLGRALLAGYQLSFVKFAFQGLMGFSKATDLILLMVLAVVYCYAVDPSGELTVSTESSQGSVDRKKDILSYLLRPLGITKLSQALAIDLMLPAINGDPKGCLIAALCFEN